MFVRHQLRKLLILSLIVGFSTMSLFAQTTSLQHHGLLKSHMDIFLAGFLGEFSDIPSVLQTILLQFSNKPGDEG